MIRHNAEQWKIKTDRIAVCGFSAGGHLAGSLGVHWERYGFEKEDSLHKISNRPNAMILCYPVLTTQFPHQGSIMNLLGDNATNSDFLKEFSLELNIGTTTPPAFLWRTAEDPGVPVENSLLFAQHLKKNGIPFELHVFPKGKHGLGLATEDSHVSQWMPLCCRWLEKIDWL